MWDDSHEISSPIFSEKITKLILSSATYMLSGLKVKECSLQYLLKYSRKCEEDHEYHDAWNDLGSSCFHFCYSV